MPSLCGTAESVSYLVKRMEERSVRLFREQQEESLVEWQLEDFGCDRWRPGWRAQSVAETGDKPDRSCFFTVGMWMRARSPYLESLFLRKWNLRSDQETLQLFFIGTHPVLERVWNEWVYLDELCGGWLWLVAKEKTVPRDICWQARNSHHLFVLPSWQFVSWSLG